jgi:hypothetical protein
LDEEKSKYAGLDPKNGFAPAYVLTSAEASERHSKAVHLLQKSVINMKKR